MTPFRRNHPLSTRPRIHGLRAFKSGIISKLLAFAIMYAASCSANAQTLLEALDLARTTEPTLLGTKATGLAAKEKSKQAFAGLLPQITASTSTNSNSRDYFTRNSPTPAAADSFNSNSRQVNLTQPLWRRSNVIAVKQADAVVSQTGYQIVAAEQELLAKLISAWCDTMSARDSMLFSTRQTATARQNLEIFGRGVSIGIASAPALEDARAKYEQAVSEQTSAETDLMIKTAALEQLTGPLHAFQPPFLSARFQLQELSKESLDTLTNLIDDHSPGVLAATRALDAASEEVRKQRAGHEPTVDLVGSYSQNSQAVGGFPGQNGYDIKLGTVGVQLNLPLYSGGGQSAKVGEALAMRDKAKQDLESARRTSRYAIKQAWLGWRAGIARHIASIQAVKSALFATKTAAVGAGVGVKMELDLLQARQQLEGAKRDLNKARYDLIVSAFRLRSVVGQLTDEDFTSLNKMFTAREAETDDIALLQ